jgi:flagellin FlaB
MRKFTGLLGSLHKNEKGITGLETAIILIAFVIVASVFAFVVLSTGLFSAEKGKAAVFAGLEKASGNLEVRGAVTAAATPPTVDTITFNLGLAAAGVPTLVDPLTISAANNIAINYIDAQNRFPNVTWTVNWILAETTLGLPTPDTLLERGELVEITVDIVAAGATLDINEEFTLEVIPPSGGTLLLNRTMPQQIDVVMDLH